MSTRGERWDPLENLPQAITEGRIRLNLTQAAMARKLGVSLATVRRWEAGEAAPTSAPVQSRLRELLAVSAPLRQLQEQTEGFLGTAFELERWLKGQDLGTKEAVEALEEVLADMTRADASSRFEEALKAVVLQASAPLRLIAAKLVGTPLEGTLERVASRVQRDVTRPVILLLLASLREAVQEEVALLNTTGKSGARKRQRRSRRKQARA